MCSPPARRRRPFRCPSRPCRTRLPSRRGARQTQSPLRASVCTARIRHLNVAPTSSRNHLIELGVSAGDLVGLFIDRSLDMVVAIVADSEGRGGIRAARSRSYPGRPARVHAARLGCVGRRVDRPCWPRPSSSGRASARGRVPRSRRERPSRQRLATAPRATVGPESLGLRDLHVGIDRDVRRASS